MSSTVWDIQENQSLIRRQYALIWGRLNREELAELILVLTMDHSVVMCQQQTEETAIACTSCHAIYPAFKFSDGTLMRIGSSRRCTCGCRRFTEIGLQDVRSTEFEE